MRRDRIPYTAEVIDVIETYFFRRFGLLPILSPEAQTFPKSCAFQL